MSYSPIPVFSLLKALPPDYIDLASSGVKGPRDLRELGIEELEIPLSGINPYGWEPLRELIAERFNLKPENIALTMGASTANYALLASLAEFKTPVAVEHPGYQPFYYVVEAITGRHPMIWVRVPQENYQLNLERWLSLDPLPAVTMVTNLHNPTGTLVDDKDLIRLAQEAEKIGGVVVVDEIFRPFVPGKEWTTVALKHPNLYATGSLTKVWGLGGLRIGWVIAPPEVIARVYSVIDHIYVVMPFISEYLSYQILKRNEVESALLRRARDIAWENLSIATSFLDSMDGIYYHPPDGGIVLFCQWNDDLDSEFFCRELYHSHRILLQPGWLFGVRQGFRLGFGTDKEQLIKGLEKVRQLWEKFHHQRF